MFSFLLALLFELSYAYLRTVRFQFLLNHDFSIILCYFLGYLNNIHVLYFSFNIKGGNS